MKVDKIIQEHVSKRSTIRGPGDIAKLCESHIDYKLDQEYFHVACLTTKNTVQAVELVFLGTLNATVTHPREIFKRAIKYSSAAIVLIHNHPSGDPEPSKEDIQFTRNIVQACTIMGIQLLDHVIVGTTGGKITRYCSLRESGIEGIFA